MGRFLKTILYFILCLVLIYPLGIAITGLLMPVSISPAIKYKKGLYGFMHTRLKELKSLDSRVDILVLGSSHAYRGLDPRNFSEKLFNLGSSSQTPVQTQLLLNRYLNLVDPGIILYEVYPETFASDGIESSLDLIANDKNDWLSLGMAAELKSLKVFNTLICGIVSDYLLPDRNFTEPVSNEEDTYIPGGYVEKQMQYFHRELHQEKRTWIPESMQMDKFKEIIGKFKQDNKRLVLIYAPITPALYQSYSNNPVFDSTMQSFGMEYYNFNTLIKLDDSLHFYDAHHLNQDGVNLFNARLKDILEKGDL